MAQSDGQTYKQTDTHKKFIKSKALAKKAGKEKDHYGPKIPPYKKPKHFV